MDNLNDDEDELQSLIGTTRQGKCSVGGCQYSDIDERGPVFLGDIEYWVCTLHWEAIVLIVGQQIETIADEEVEVFMRGYEAVEDIIFREEDGESEPDDYSETQPSSMTYDQLMYTLESEGI